MFGESCSSGGPSREHLPPRLARLGRPVDPRVRVRTERAGGQRVGWSFKPDVRESFMDRLLGYSTARSPHRSAANLRAGSGSQNRRPYSMVVGTGQAHRRRHRRRFRRHLPRRPREAPCGRQVQGAWRATMARVRVACGRRAYRRRSLGREFAVETPGSDHSRSRRRPTAGRPTTTSCGARSRPTSTRTSARSPRASSSSSARWRRPRASEGLDPIRPRRAHRPRHADAGEVRRRARPRALQSMRESRARGSDDAQEPIALEVDRVKARFGAWQLFPRSWGGLKAVEGVCRSSPSRLRRPLPAAVSPDRASGTGRAQNSLVAGPDDPGSPYAIGGAEGGHLPSIPS